MSVQTPIDEAGRLFRASAARFREALSTIAQGAATNNADLREQGRASLARSLRWAQAAADLLGRRRVRLESRSAKSAKVSRSLAHPHPRHYAVGDPGDIVESVPRVPFEDAIADLLDRMPVAIRDVLGPKAEQIAAVYSERHAFALAKVADERVTNRIQQILIRALERGVPTAKVVSRVMEEGEDFTDAYAETVVRTNLATAYSAGRFREAADPDIRDEFPAFEYQAISDSRVRQGRRQDGGENHLALDGFVARTTWGGWSTWAPPNGYACRCALRLVGLDELERRRIDLAAVPAVPSGASAHPNFTRGRPDHQLYLGVQA